jgi:hypothetical protein
MRQSPTTLLILSVALVAGCAAIPPVAPAQQTQPTQRVVRVPVYVVPNCNLPVAHACQWIEPPAGDDAQAPMPQRVKGIAL